MPVTFACIVEEVKPIITKSNKRMAFVRVADFTGSLEGAIFPEPYKEFEETLQVDAVLAVKGKISERNDEKSILIESMKRL